MCLPPAKLLHRDLNSLKLDHKVRMELWEFRSWPNFIFGNGPLLAFRHVVNMSVRSQFPIAKLDQVGSAGLVAVFSLIQCGRLNLNVFHTCSRSEMQDVRFSSNSDLSRWFLRNAFSLSLSISSLRALSPERARDVSATSRTNGFFSV